MEQHLKERLVGAVVLVSAAVLFIPMILSGPGEDAAAPPAQRPAEAPAAPPAARFSSRVVPVTPPGSTPDPAPAPAPAPAVPEPAPPPATGPAGDTAKAAPAPPRQPPAAAPQQPRSREGWVVQLGSFSNARNAMALRDRLADGGYAAFAESTGSGAQAVTRVYVGPEAEREQAERHVARLLKETRLKGIVVRYPGE